MNGNRSSIVELLDKLFKSKLDERGRIYIPKAVRNILSLQSGDKVYIELEDESFMVFTVKAIQRRLAE